MPTRKARGRRTQHLVAEAFRNHGWTNAESTPASVPGPDIQGLTGIDVEVAARRGLVLADKLRQLARRDNGDLGIVVLRLDGQGEDATQYAAVLRLGDLLDVLAGHPDYRPDADDLAAAVARHPSNITLGTGLVIYR